VELQALIAGGGQERNLRSGTENVAAIVGFGAACVLAAENVKENRRRLTDLRQQLETGLSQQGARIFGSGAERLPNTSYFAFPGVDGETLVGVLDRDGFAVASGAACSSANPEPSRVLMAMGVAPEAARGAVRVSLGAASSEAQVADFLKALKSAIERLTGLTAMAV